MIFVPARFAAAAIDEAIDAGVDTVIAITEGIPVLDMLRDLLEGEGGGRAADRAQLPRCPLARQVERGDHPGAVLRSGLDRRRLEVGHAHLPDRQRAEAGGDGQLLDRRHRRRPDRRLGLHRHPRAVRGRRRDRADRDGRRDRRRRRGARRGLHRRAGLQAGRRLHRRLHGAARQADGPRRGDHLRLLRNRRGEEGGPGGARRPRRALADRGRRNSRSRRSRPADA